MKLLKYAEFIEMEQSLSTTLPFVEEKKSSAAIEEDSSTTMKRSNKSVHFAPQIKVNFIPHVNDYSEEEIKHIWYDANETGTIKAECTATVVKVMEQKPLNTDTECFRGLEYRTADGVRKRTWNKNTALDAVLDRQETLWDFNKIDEESISLAYRKYSVSCQEAAHKLGLRDERFIHYSSSDWRQLKKESKEERSSSPLSRSVDAEISPIRKLIGPGPRSFRGFVDRYTKMTIETSGL
jgi:hypothetical protein